MKNIIFKAKQSLLLLLFQSSFLLANPPDISFSHSIKEHLSIKCEHCHSMSSASSSTTERPGEKEHALCSEAGCHDIYQAQGSRDLSNQLCLSCHTKAEPWRISTKDIKDFPSEEDRNQRNFCVSFEHESHLSDKPADAQKECLGCHIVNIKEKTRNNPAHPQCVECHSLEENRKLSQKIHPMKNCEQCHSLKQDKQNRLCTQWTHARSSKISKFFKHEKHLVDVRKGANEPLSCAFCHPNITQVKNTKNKNTKFNILSPQAMSKSCDECHNGKTIDPRTKKTVFAANLGIYCSKCHGKNFSEAQIKQGHTGVW